MRASFKAVWAFIRRYPYWLLAVLGLVMICALLLVAILPLPAAAGVRSVRTSVAAQRSATAATLNRTSGSTSTPRTPTPGEGLPSAALTPTLTATAPTVNPQTATARAIEALTATITNTPCAGCTPTRTPTATWFVRFFDTRTPAYVPSLTPTITRTQPTPTPSTSPTPTISSTVTVSATPTQTGTATPTHTPTTTPTFTQTPTSTQTRTPTMTPTSTFVPTPRLAFSADGNGDGWLDVLSMNPDGSDVRTLVQTTSHSLVCDWSPDHNWLVYEVQNPAPTLALVRADGGLVLAIAGLPAGENSQAAWSPDGRWIVFRNLTPAPELQPDLYLIHPDGSGLLRLTWDAYDESDPDWAPGSDSLVFISNQDGNPEVYSLDVAWTRFDPPTPPSPLPVPLRLTSTSEQEASPHISPDGLRLVFARSDSAQWEIYAVQTGDWGTLANLSGNPADDYAPSWSEDGTWIAFLSTRDGGSEIYRMTADGGSQGMIGNGMAGEQRPVFAP